MLVAGNCVDLSWGKMLFALSVPASSSTVHLFSNKNTLTLHFVNSSFGFIFTTDLSADC